MLFDLGQRSLVHSCNNRAYGRAVRAYCAIISQIWGWRLMGTDRRSVFAIIPADAPQTDRGIVVYLFHGSASH